MSGLFFDSISSINFQCKFALKFEMRELYESLQIYIHLEPTVKLPFDATLVNKRLLASPLHEGLKFLVALIYENKLVKYLH